MSLDLDLNLVYADVYEIQLATSRNFYFIYLEFLVELDSGLPARLVFLPFINYLVASLGILKSI